MTINRLTELMSEASGISVKVAHRSPRQGDVLHSRADISAARDALGYEPTVTLVEGLKDYMAWAKSEL